MYNYVAVIACHGRHELLKWTIWRLLNKNGMAFVVCVGGPEEREVCESAGAFFVEHENRPLGKKWNAGFQKASELACDGVVFVGSSDWLSDNWMDVMVPYMGKYDMVGKPDFYMVDLGDTVRSCMWTGYGPDRAIEPIGIGRVVSAHILDEFDWKPFVDSANNSMDFAMFNKVKANAGQYTMITGDHIKALSISTNRWPNMHRFDDHWNDKVPAKSVRLQTEWIDIEFPEYKLIFT